MGMKRLFPWLNADKSQKEGKVSGRKNIRIAAILITAIVVLSMFAMAAVGAGNGQNEELEAIRRAIEEKGAEWVADETSVSKLPKEVFKRLLGAKLLAPEEEEGEEPRKEGEGQPSQLDWRNVDGKDYTTPIKDQCVCGSCVAFGALGAFEANFDIYFDNPDYNWDGSEAHLFWCGGGTCAGGWNAREAVQYLLNNGVPDEACFPYPCPGNLQDSPCSDTCSDWQDRAEKIEGWAEFRGVSNMISYLLDAPIEACFDVYEDFRYYSGGIYEHVWGEYLGGHCVTVVGYNDIDDYWICKNSWGTSWGESGWFKIRFGECKIDWYFAYAMTLVPPCTAEVALEGESRRGDLALLRRFRDEVLATSPIGRSYIDLCYKHSPEVVKMLLLDSDLRAHTRAVIEGLMPGIRGLLGEGAGQEMVLTEDMIEDIEALLDDLAARASPDLRAVIEANKRQLEGFKGKTFEEIRSKTIDVKQPQRWGGEPEP